MTAIPPPDLRLQTSPGWAVPAVCAILAVGGPGTGVAPAETAQVPLPIAGPEPLDQAVAATPTGPGARIPEEVLSPRQILHLLHRWSGLTWDQVAELFGVDRRSVHFWSSGRALNADNEEHLYQLWAVLQFMDRGLAPVNRAALLSAGEDGLRPFDLLARHQYAEARAHLGRGQGRRPGAELPRLPAEKARAWGLPVDTLAQALIDPVATEPGKERPAKAARREKG